jgi:signal transduction histidine kinase
MAVGPLALLGAVGVGALITLGAVWAVQRVLGLRELGNLRLTLAASADWWWRTDAAMKVIEVGPGQRAHSVVDPQRLIGRAPWEMVEQDDVPPLIAQAIQARAPFFDQLLDLHVNGHLHTFALSGMPLHSSTASFGGYVGVVRDVTATLATMRGPNQEQAGLIARLQADAAERNRQFELAVKDLDSFAHSVSHDLRAPLRVVDGFANIVLEDYGKRLDDLGREHVRRIIAAGSRMNSMIDTLLDMSRTTSRELERERVDLSQLARGLVEELAAQRDVRAGPRNIDLVITDGLVDEGDHTLLRLVLQNLLSNAAKFTGKTPAARIEFGAIDTEGRRTYFVRDNGAGFDMRFAEKLFGLFQRFHSQNEFPGTGVGLATVQRIVRKHGGRIWAESEPGKGAAFYFTLWEQK